MTKRVTARGTRNPARGKNPSARDPFRLVKGIVLIVVAVSALGAGIYKGGDGIFFGAIFAMGFGLLGVLSLVRST
ncbi:MAG TPA: hypothetical protein DCR97_14850 [Deltaproteobacteria bacterium]|nr:hypothetical protein [Deltaproteobacteria bacterium]